MNQTKFYQLDSSVDWVKKLQDELNESVDDPSFLDKTKISINLEIKKIFDPKMGEILLVEGSYSSLFATKCVKSFKDMHDSVMGEFKSAFIGEEFQKDEAYQELTDIYINQDTYELYYHGRGVADLYEMIHEQVYLEVNQYPQIEESLEN